MNGESDTMDRNMLLESAGRLKQATEASAAEYDAMRDSLVVRINERLLAREDIEFLVGPHNLAMMRDNHANHARFIASILKFHNPEALLDTIVWVFRAYRSRGFHVNYWAAQLNAWMDVLKEMLSADAYADILPLYEWMQVNIPAFTALSGAAGEEQRSFG